MSQARRQLGAHGEDVVADWYRARGYRIVDRNWRCREGEIDLVVTSPRSSRTGAGGAGTLVFCEVKTRSSYAFGSPAEAVTRTKQLRLRTLATRWLAERRVYTGGEIRFDVASVMGDRVDVFEAAF